ncbi:MAG TPA: hypothetical protein DCS67_02170 [Clostridiales bacterium UBA8960]|jgi:hypothetical protein|nr:hypothetical protein [Clostridiales bacterium UBA8960]
MKKIKWIDWIFMGTLMFFVLSMVHISLALVGFICMLTPFVLYMKTRKKLWCTTYCPRAALFTKMLSKASLGMTPPTWLFSAKTKRMVVNFFCINLLFVVMSTVMVSMGRFEPMAYIRFLIAFPLPVQLPQLFSWVVPDVITHLGYRIFSVMFTSTVVGLVIGIMYKPRTWCGICPVQTLTTQIK